VQSNVASNTTIVHTHLQHTNVSPPSLSASHDMCYFCAMMGWWTELLYRYTVCFPFTCCPTSA